MQSEQEIYEIDKLNMLEAQELQFTKEKSGYMTLVYKGNTYPMVKLTRLIPFITKDEYISVSYETEEMEFREIGVIKDLKVLERSQSNLINEYLEFKYYMPEITKIHSIKDNRRGYIFVDVETTSGRKTLCIGDWYSNFKMLSKEKLYVVDVDGNKYFAPNIYNLDKKSLAQIELFI